MGWDSLSQRQASETVTLAAKKKQKNGVCDQVNGSMLYAGMHVNRPYIRRVRALARQWKSFSRSDDMYSFCFFRFHFAGRTWTWFVAHRYCIHCGFSAAIVQVWIYCTAELYSSFASRTLRRGYDTGYRWQIFREVRTCGAWVRRKNTKVEIDKKCRP